MKLLVYFLVLLSMTFVVFGAPDVENVSITPSPVLLGSTVNCSYDWAGPGVDNSNITWFVNDDPNTVYCYQETANSSSAVDGACALNYSGSYGSSSFTTVGYFLINYTKPTNAVGTQWEFKGGKDAGFQVIQDNATISETINQDCWNLDSDKLVLAITSEETGSVNQIKVYCYNDTASYPLNGKKLLFESASVSLGFGGGSEIGIANMLDGNWSTHAAYSSGDSYWYDSTVIGARIYEEAMHWDIEGYDLGDNLTCEVTPINDTGQVGTKVNSSSEIVQLWTNTSYYFNDVVLHTTTQNFNISFDNLPGSVISAIGFLEFNNTNTTASVVVSSTEVMLSVTDLVMPVLLSGNYTFNFTWHVNATSINADEVNFTYANSTLVSYFGVDNCSTYSTVAVNYSLLKEDDDSALTGPVDLFYNVTLPNSSYYPGFALDFAGRTYYEACIFPSWASTTTDIQGVYSSSGYSERSYYADDYVLDSTLSSVSLYLVENTSVVQFTVLGTEGNGVSGAYVHIYKYDPGSHTTILSQVLNTDSDGVAYGEIVLDTEWYTFIVMYDGEIELETSPTKVTSVTKTFRINPDTDYYDEYEDAFSISNSLDYFSLSTYFSFVYIDNSGKVNQGCLKVVRNSVRGEQVMNDTCVSGATGVINYYVPASPGDFDYTATSYVIFNTGEEFVLDSETVSFTDLHETYGVEGLFIAVLILIALAAAGIAHPSMSIAFVCFGLVAVIALGLFKISWVSAVSLVIIGGLAIYRVGTK